MKNCYAICYNPVLESSFDIMNRLKNILVVYNVEYKVFSIDELDKDCGFVFVIGGDGTILKTARFYSKYGVPIFGINLGHLGFLSQAGINDLSNVVAKIINNDYKIENRIMLSTGNYTALNDFVIKGGETSRASKFSLEIDGKYVCEYFADGLIISTPTGSTAYGMSAGGPVLTPDLGAIEIVPICPHTFSARPIVVSSESILKIISNTDSKCVVCADGQEVFEFSCDINIKKADYYAKLALLNENDFYSVLRNKLYWGIAPCAN